MFDEDSFFTLDVGARLNHVLSEWRTRADGEEYYTHLFNVQMTADDSTDDEESYGIEGQLFEAQLGQHGSFNVTANSSDLINSMAYPSDEYGGNYDSAIITAAEEVISATPVGALFSARDIYSAYNADRDFDSTGSKSINLEESYAVGNTRASHFVGMEVDLDQKYHSTSSEMTIDCGVPGLAMAEFTVTFVPGGSVSPSQEHDLSHGDLNSMGEPDLAEYGIERITPGELRRGDYDGTLPDWKVREFLDRDGPIYIVDFPIDLLAGSE